MHAVLGEPTPRSICGPISKSVAAGMTDIVELLLENGADTTIPEKDG